MSPSPIKLEHPDVQDSDPKAARKRDYDTTTEEGEDLARKPLKVFDTKKKQFGTSLRRKEGPVVRDNFINPELIPPGELFNSNKFKNRKHKVWAAQFYQPDRGASSSLTSPKSARTY